MKMLDRIHYTFATKSNFIQRREKRIRMLKIKFKVKNIYSRDQVSLKNFPCLNFAKIDRDF